jgi:hypothetical protein
MIEKKYPKQFGPGSWLGLLRVINDDAYLDWPWGRERLHPGPFQSMTTLLFHVLDRAYGFPNSVFIMGSEYSNFAWNVPFPAFTNSPSFKKADLPWPWLEAFTSELNLHRKVMENVKTGPNKFDSSQYHNAFAEQIPWNEKINKALYRASILVGNKFCFLHRLSIQLYLRIFDKLSLIKLSNDLISSMHCGWAKI